METVKPYVDHLHVLFVAFGGHSLSGNPLSGYFSERQSGRRSGAGRPTVIFGRR